MHADMTSGGTVNKNKKKKVNSEFDRQLLDSFISLEGWQCNAPIAVSIILYLSSNSDSPVIMFETPTLLVLGVEQGWLQSQSQSQLWSLDFE